MTANLNKVLVTGDVTFNSLLYLDEFPSPRPQTVFSKAFHETVGGTAAGKALNLHKLGVDITLHGLIGDDEYGARIRAYCEQAGLPFVYDVDPKGTQRHINLMAGSGGRISIYAAYATFEPEIDLSRLEALIAGCECVALNLSNYCRRLIPLARQHDKPVWCDIHDYDGQNPYHRDFIDAADVLTMSSDALPDYRAFMEKMIAAGKRLVICTHGKDGATALTPDGRWIEIPARTEYEQVDTNGAGDAFFAGVLYGQMRGYDVARCLQTGSIVAGLCVTSTELAAPDLSVARVEADYQRFFGT
ncbi:MAG: carbohydrate kinase family protein [Anaerolineae bacterium]|nr:carbohydrate kinase family protein [Anaerolineae bacterium]